MAALVAGILYVNSHITQALSTTALILQMVLMLVFIGKHAKYIGIHYRSEFYFLLLSCYKDPRLQVVLVECKLGKVGLKNSGYWISPMKMIKLRKQKLLSLQKNIRIRSRQK
jgi:hypothetical protein